MITESLLLVIAMVFAVATIVTPILRHAIIFVGVFSFVVSFLYLNYGAPDVAIAEAVIGSGLVMLLFLTAMKRHRTYVVCVVDHTVNQIEDATIAAFESSPHGKIVDEIRRFCLNRELEPQIVYTVPRSHPVVVGREYDLVVHFTGEETAVEGLADNFIVDELEMLLVMHGLPVPYRIDRVEALR